MADALISPAVGGAMWGASAGLAAYSAHRLKREAAESRAPMMGVLGAFVFAAQMINFAIPGTGSSGHLGGGMLLAVLLGPHAAFLAMFSILAVQALFFADGGLLALGCNAFNMGFWPCFVAYPLVRRWLAGGATRRRLLIVGASVSALQLGAFGVVLETTLSGISELPFGKFVLFMQPIHLAIGIVEGLVTTALVAFVWKARPEMLEPAGPAGGPARGSRMRPVLAAFAAGAVLAGGLLSWFASSRPDGLEWAAGRTSGREELAAPGDRWHRLSAWLQARTSWLPDYGFRSNAPEPAAEPNAQEAEPYPAVSAGTSTSGLLGGLMVLALAGAVGASLRLFRRPE